MTTSNQKLRFGRVGKLQTWFYVAPRKTRGIRTETQTLPSVAFFDVLRKAERTCEEEYQRIPMFTKEYTTSSRRTRKRPRKTGAIKPRRVRRLPNERHRGTCDRLGVGARVRSQLIERNRTSNPRMHRQNKWLASHTAVDRISCSGMRTSACAPALSTISFFASVIHLDASAVQGEAARARWNLLAFTEYHWITPLEAGRRAPRLSPANRKRVREYTINVPTGSFGPDHPPHGH